MTNEELAAYRRTDRGVSWNGQETSRKTDR